MITLEGILRIHQFHHHSGIYHNGLLPNSYKKERPSAPSEDNVSSLNSCYYLRDLGLSQLRKGLETFCIVNCQVCQHLSVHINACKLQTVHELAVR